MTNNDNLKVRYEGILTIVPHKPTFPRPSFPILSVTKDMQPGIFKLCFNVILCYNKVSSEDSGWVVAGWTKTSMGIALSEKPMLAGRLRRVDDDDDDGGLEIVTNDSGIRLVEAEIAVSMEEFVSVENNEEVQKQLVCWESIDDQDPRFSPLMYFQVTNFKCGSYSLGISCSLLIADPLSMTSFLKRWAEIHINLVNESQTPNLPLFYLPNFGKSSSTLLYTSTRATSEKTSRQTMIFKYAKINSTTDSEMQRSIAVACIEKAISRLGNKATSKFTLLVKESSNGIIMNIDTIYVKQVLPIEFSKDFDGICRMNTSWSDYIDSGISIAEGHKPNDILYWICSPADEGLAMIISSHSDMTVIVTVPNEKNSPFTADF